MNVKEEKIKSMQTAKVAIDKKVEHLQHELVKQKQMAKSNINQLES